MAASELGLEQWPEGVAAQLLNLSVDLTCVAGFDGYFRELSEGWMPLLGLPMPVLTSRPLLEFVHPDDVDSTAAALDEARRGGEVTCFENRFVAADGTNRWLQWTAVGVPAEQGFRAVARDLTPQREAELAVGESEQRYLDLIQSSYDIVQSIAPDGHFMFVNRAWHEHLGYTEEELAGLTLFDIVVEADYAHCSMLIARLMQGESFDHVEVTFIAKGGRTFPVEGNATGRFRDGEYVATHTFFRDVTDVRKAEALTAAYQHELEHDVAERSAALVRSEKLATLGRLSAGMAHELNNPAAAARRGAAQLQEAVTRTYTALTALAAEEFDADAVTRLGELIRSAAAGASSVTTLDPLIRSDREEQVEQWLHARGVADSWSLAGSLVAQELDPDALDRVAASFPPSALPAVLTALADSYSTAAILEQIGHGAQRISQIVGALKDYSYMDRAPVQDVDVHDGLNSTLVMLQSKLKSGIVVERQYGPDLPHIEAPGSELNQVWTNLIDNAIDAMGGTGRLVIRTEAAGDGVAVEIEDDGPGIPSGVVDKVFDPFFTTKGPGRGTGLGLNITFNIVRGCGGTIDVDSRPGRTVFRVRLPLRLEADRTQDAAAEGDPS